MDDASGGKLLTQLVEVLDEMRETTNLLPAVELARTSQRRGWRKFAYGFARSRGEISAGFAMQYLTENLGRARDHWRDAVSMLSAIEGAGVERELMTRMIEDLNAAGVDEVLPLLRSEAIPYAASAVATHLSLVVATIRDCEQVVAAARSRLARQRLGDQA
ncbi:MAG TPA: hypothetical protein VFE86_19090 [Ilumatobacteraceae bacterium]|nr:hypothetical protein [Ilumatobacteraceae bacterium]